MEESDELLHQIGAFEPSDAKKLLPVLEAEKIPFEVEADHTALGAPGRTLSLNFGMYPEGSKLVVYVPESALPQAQAAVARLFPV